MRVLLVSPINRTYVIMPMLGLGYLASIARKNRCEVSILDCKLEGFDYRDFEDYIKANRFDLIGFQIFTYDLISVKRHIDIIRKYQKEAVVIVGGAHPSGDPVGTLTYLEKSDFAFRGEGEIGFEILLNKLRDCNSQPFKTDYKTLEDIPGLAFRSPDNRVIVNAPRFVDNLDTLDFPAWDLMGPGRYPEAPHGAFARQFPAAPIIITRGCPLACTFCAGKAITGAKTRARSIDNVWLEVQYLTDRFKVKELLIEDENFTMHKKLLNDFCLKIINSNKKISWNFPSGVRLDTLNKENLRLMEEAGCYSMAVGVEFGSQRIHDLTKKRLSIELIKDKISLLSKTKIKTTGFFLFGIPGETREDILATINLSLKLKIDRAQFNNFMPLPGSELWDELVRKNKLVNVNWNEFFVHSAAFAPDGLTKRELKNLQRLAYIKFYLRPRIIYGLLKEIRSFRHLNMIFNRFVDALS